MAPTATAVLPDMVPEVAVTVMEEPGAAAPRESVVVALPELSVAPVVVDRVPLLLVKVIATPDIAAPLPSVAVAVMVDVVDPSAGRPPEFDTAIALSVPACPVGVVELLKASPPHAANNIVNAATAAAEKNLCMSHPANWKPTGRAADQ